MSGTAENDISIGSEPANTAAGTAPAAADPEAAPPEALPPDASNRTLVDEEGPF